MNATRLQERSTSGNREINVEYAAAPTVILGQMFDGDGIVTAGRRRNT